VYSELEAFRDCGPGRTSIGWACTNLPEARKQFRERLAEMGLV
jgi:hypothetical protein